MSVTSSRQVSTEWRCHHFILHISVEISKYKWSVCLNVILLLLLHSSFWRFFWKFTHFYLQRDDKCVVLRWCQPDSKTILLLFYVSHFSVPHFRCEDGDSQIWNQEIQWDLQRIWQSRFIFNLLVSITHLQTVCVSFSLSLSLDRITLLVQFDLNTVTEKHSG